MVWTLVCSGRSGCSGHPWGVQILDAWSTLDGTSGLDGRVNLDACADFNTSGRQESGRSGFVGNAGRAGNTLLAAQLSNADFPPLGHLEQFGSCTRLSNDA